MAELPIKRDYRVSLEENDGLVKRRIKEEQAKLGYTDGQMADAIEIPVTTYKNYIKKDGTKKIKASILWKLSDVFHCTFDHLAGGSEEFNNNIDGGVPQKAINMSEAYAIRAEVSKYLGKDFRTLQSLHMLFCEISPSKRKMILDAFNFIADAMKKGLVLDRKDELTPKALEMIKEGLANNHPSYTQCLIHYSNARRDQGRNANKKALKGYMIILDEYIRQTWYVRSLIKDIADDALKSIKELSRWQCFPKQLSRMESIDFEALLMPETKEIVRSYVGERETFDDSPQKEEEYAVVFKKSKEEEEARLKKRQNNKSEGE